jgi:hypothetical protein
MGSIDEAGAAIDRYVQERNGDDQRRLAHPTFGQRSREFRAIGPLAAFHLDELGERRRAEAGKVG